MLVGMYLIVFQWNPKLCHELFRLPEQNDKSKTHFLNPSIHYLPFSNSRSQWVWSLSRLVLGENQYFQELHLSKWPLCNIYLCSLVVMTRLPFVTVSAAGDSWWLGFYTKCCFCTVWLQGYWLPQVMARLSTAMSRLPSSGSNWLQAVNFHRSSVAFLAQGHIVFFFICFLYRV